MKKVLAILMITALSLSLKAQHHEFGPFLGTMYYLGDLSANSQFGLPSYNFGAMYRYQINQRAAFRVAGHYGKIYGDSELNKKNLRFKNLSFYSNITDIEAAFEINFLKYSAGSSKNRFTPYIFAGVSLFKFNPMTDYGGKSYALQPLGTEGQGSTAYPDKKPYKLTSFAIPFGGGLKLSVSRNVSIGVEWSMHKTFTDYLDDISGRYVDQTVLSAENGPISAILSNRALEEAAILSGLDLSIGPNGQPTNQSDYNSYMEMISNSPYNFTNGLQRGNSEDKDWYSILGVTIMFKLKGPRKATCPAYKQHFYFKEYKVF